MSRSLERGQGRSQALNRAAARVLVGVMSVLAVEAPLPSPAHAQQGRDPVAADALFREARELLKTANYNEACPKLAESFRLDPAPGTLYNLAECEEKRGRSASAIERWRALIDLLTATNKLTDPRLTVAKQRVAVLMREAPTLAVRVKAGAPAETVVLRDTIELRGPSLGVELPVDPGEHVVIARAAYHRDGQFRFTVKEGEHKVVEVEPGPPDGTAPSPSSSAAVPPPRPTGSVAPPPTGAPTATIAPTASTEAVLVPSSRRTYGIVVGSIGVASLIGAGITTGVLASKKSTRDENCDGKRCLQEGIDANESIKKFKPINLALWIVGAVGVGAGAALFFSAPSDSKPQVSFSTSGSETSLWLSGKF